MKVLMLGWEYPPEITGGLGTACAGLVKALSSEGTEIIFVAPHVDDSMSDSHVRFVNLSSIEKPAGSRPIKERVKNIAVKSPLRPYLSESTYAEMLKQLADLSAKLGQQSILSYSEGYGADLAGEVNRYASALETVVVGEQFDVIHAHDWMTFPAAIHLKQLADVPLVLHVHSLEVDRTTGRPDAAIMEVERRAFEAADHIASVSFYTKAKLVQIYEVPEWKITVVHNAVSKRDPSWPLQIEKPFDHKLVLFLGRVTSQKGPEYFIEAAARVIEKDSSVWFAMAGSGDMLPKMIERAAELRISSNFHFTGFLRGPEVERMYAMSDLYVMPSVSEPFGLSSLEAVMYDVPVIVSRQSGAAEVLRHSLKVNFWDVDQLADTILAVLRYPALRDMMVRLCGDEIADLCWENAAEKVIQIYNMVIDGVEQ